jgi:hypothetical protein
MYKNLTDEEAMLLYGTKMASVITFLLKLWEKDDKEQVILFSQVIKISFKFVTSAAQFQQVLERVEHLLSENSITSTKVSG